MIWELREEVTQMRQSRRNQSPRSQGGASVQERGTASPGRDSSEDDDSHEKHSETSSITKQRLLFSRTGMPQGDDPPNSMMAAVQTRTADPKKELDEIKGIGPWPSTAAYNAWRRNTRYVIAAGSATPQAALEWIILAEKWKGRVEDLPIDPKWETLGAKVGKALRAILKGDFL